MKSSIDEIKDEMRKTKRAFVKKWLFLYPIKKALYDAGALNQLEHALVHMTIHGIKMLDETDKQVLKRYFFKGETNFASKWAAEHYVSYTTAYREINNVINHFVYFLCDNNINWCEVQKTL